MAAQAKSQGEVATVENAFIREMLVRDHQQTLLDDAARWRRAKAAHRPASPPREALAVALIALAIRLAPSVGQAGQLAVLGRQPER
jgi:hypothetical protein